MPDGQLVGQKSDQFIWWTIIADQFTMVGHDQIWLVGTAQHHCQHSHQPPATSTPAPSATDPQHQHSHQHQLNGDSAPLPDIKATFTTYTTTRRPHLQEQYASHLVAEGNAGGDFRRQCVCFRTERQGKHLLQQRGPHPCDVAIEVPTPAPTPAPAPAQDRQWLLWPWYPQHLQYQWSRW